MFALQPKPTFKVEISIPTPEGKPGKFVVEFKHKGRKAFKAFIEGFSAEGEERQDVDVLLDIVAGWQGVDAPFNKDNLETLLDNYSDFAATVLLKNPGTGENTNNARVTMVNGSPCIWVMCVRAMRFLPRRAPSSATTWRIWI